MAVDIKDYGYAQNIAAAGLAQAQQIRNVPSESDLREKALAMAIDFHRSHGDVDGVEATAAKFLAFLKGDANV
jgi:hypothetical protein